MTEIRGLILPKDIDKFDTEVMEREVEAMKVHKYIIINNKDSVKALLSIQIYYHETWTYEWNKWKLNYQGITLEKTDSEMTI